MPEIVPNIEHFTAQYRHIVQQLVQTRKQAGLSQEQLAQFCKIDRRKIMALEAGQKIDLLTLISVADLLDTQINLQAKTF